MNTEKYEEKIMRYKFRYYNGTFKVLNALFIPLQNLLLPYFFVLLILRLISLIGLGQYLNNDVAIHVIQKIILVLSFSWALIYIICRKGVFLYDDRLTIARYTITTRNWRNRITISYDKIDSVNVNYSDLRFTKYHGSLLVPFGDDNCNVELTLKNGRKYFFSIQNQEEFCDTLNLLIDKYNQKVKSDDVQS